MNIVKANRNLPVKLEDLTKFILIGREKLTSVRAEIRAINKLELATEVREQKKEEAQWLASALLDAEVRIGEILIKIPKDNPNKRIIGTNKSSKTKDIGFSSVQVSQFQQLAENKDIVEQVKAEAKDNDDLPTRTDVLNRIKIKNKEEKKQDKIENYKSLAKDFISTDIEIYHDDFVKYANNNIKDNSIDFILTDPPYPEEFLPLWQSLFDVADRILKPSKFLVAYCGHQHLDKIMKMNNNLIFYWIMKLDFTQTPLVKGRNIIATWKPVLIYQKPPFHKLEETLSDKVYEITKFDYEERDMHDDNWGQSIGKLEYLISKFVKPGELIFEPFAGTGSTLIAAQRQKVKCIGTEIEKKYINMIKGRLQDGL